MRSNSDLIKCRDYTECNRASGTNGYGIGWRLPSPLANYKAGLLLNGLVKGYICYSSTKFSEQMKAPVVSLISSTSFDGFQSSTAVVRYFPCPTNLDFPTIPGAERRSKPLL